MINFSTNWNPFAPNDTDPVTSSFVNPIVTGTNGHDSKELFRHETTIVDMLAGNDTLGLGGTADYQVDMGAGTDKVFINSTGIADVDGGAGSDQFFVTTMEEHRIDGGTGTDRLSFVGAREAVEIDLSGAGVGTAKNADGAPGAKEMSFQNIEYIYGSDHDDVFHGSESADRFYGRNGDDEVHAGGGNDVIVGENGNDKLYLGEGNDVAFGGDDNDFIAGESGDDRLYGQDGDDVIEGGAGDDYILGGSGDDMLRAGMGNDRVYGGAGADTVQAVDLRSGLDSSNDFFSGGANGEGGGEASLDTLDYSYADGAVQIYVDAGQAVGAGAGVPIVTTSGPFTMTQMFIDTFTGFERFIGTEYDDTFKGSSDETVEEFFYGGHGDDRFIASAGEDHFDGGHDQGSITSFDTVDYGSLGGSVIANLTTGRGQVMDASGDVASTHHYDGIDAIVGSDGRDQMIGDAGDNRFEGGKGADTFTGRGGADTFVFDGSEGDLAYDRIRDFGNGDDVLELANMHLVTGAEVDSFGVLDSNGDGQLTGADAHVYASGGDTFLLFDEGIIALDNVKTMQSDDFMFA